LIDKCKKKSLQIVGKGYSGSEKKKLRNAEIPDKRRSSGFY
jgi:hypothetical protein